MSLIDIFVYGTLLTGERNHHVAMPYVLAVAPGKVRGRLYNVGRYPALVLDPDGVEIHGEWFRVTQVGLEKMDLLEEYYGPDQDNDYERVWVKDLENGRAGWRYVWTDHRGCPEIPHGCWRTHRKQQEE